MADVTDRREDNVWYLLFRVAETAATARDLPTFYRSVHSIVGELMDATRSEEHTSELQSPS